MLTEKKEFKYYLKQLLNGQLKTNTETERNYLYKGKQILLPHTHTPNIIYIVRNTIAFNLLDLYT